MKLILLSFLCLVYLNKYTQVTHKEIFTVNDSDTLWGTLTISENLDTAKPLVLIIAGSGPTDRDGNNTIMKNNSLKMISEDLIKMGYPSIRYDKRGVGSSRNAYIPEEQLVFNQNVIDAETFYDYGLNLGFDKIVIAGHSEGSLIGLLLSNKRNPFKFISIAGAGRPIQEVLKEQYLATAPIVRDSAYSIIDSLSKGVKVDTLSPWLYSLFRPQIQNYIISWMAIDPQKEMAQLSCPALIVQGTTDIQVTVKDAELLHEANKSSTLVILQEMNHVLKKVGSDKSENKKTYDNPDLPLHSDFIFEIIKFLKAS